MIAFHSSIDIRRPSESVFHFLAYVDQVRQAPDSPVLALDATTSGPPGVGARYREVVRMLPFYHGEFRSEITAFEQPKLLEMVWTGPGMTGRDRYELTDIAGGTRLVHQKWTQPRGLFRIMEPSMRGALIPRLEARLQAIKHRLEEEPS